MANSSELTFELVTPEGLKFSETCHELQLPTAQGIIGVFPDHMPLVSIAKGGVVSVRKRAEDSDDKMDHFAIDGGVIEIEGSRIRLLTDAAEHADDVDELRAKEAFEDAKQLRSEARDRVALADATALLERSTARLKVAELRKHRRTTR